MSCLILNYAMDQLKTIERFLERVRSLGQIALLTDEEVEDLFGAELSAALAALDRFSQEDGVCAGCGGDCCSEMGCEVYSPRFQQCPIHATRPLLCRFHFCHRFDAVDKSLVVELRDIFLSCYTADQISRGEIARSMSVPPLETACPTLVANTQPFMNAVREGKTSPLDGAELIRKEVDRYRSHHPAAR